MHAHQASILFFGSSLSTKHTRTEFCQGMMQCVCYGMHIIAWVAICVLLSSDDTPLYVAIERHKTTDKR